MKDFPMFVICSFNYILLLYLVLNYFTDFGKRLFLVMILSTGIFTIFDEYKSGNMKDKKPDEFIMYSMISFVFGPVLLAMKGVLKLGESVKKE